MPKDEWGVKRLCPHCTSRFYDLRRDPMTCPECGHSFSLESLLAGRGRTMIVEKAGAKEMAMDDDVLDNEDDAISDESSDVDLEDDLLEDDEDDNVSLDDLTDVASEDEEG